MRLRACTSTTFCYNERGVFVALELHWNVGRSLKDLDALGPLLLTASSRIVLFMERCRCQSTDRDFGALRSPDAP